MDGFDDPGSRRRLREPSWVWAPMQVSTMLDIIGKHRCPGGCGALLDNGGPEHGPDDCVVHEVMSS